MTPAVNMRPPSAAAAHFCALKRDDSATACLSLAIASPGEGMTASIQCCTPNHVHTYFGTWHMFSPAHFYTRRCTYLDHVVSLLRCPFSQDGLEAQMDEAMQQSGPIVVRAGPAGAAGASGGEPGSPGGQSGGGAGGGFSPERAESMQAAAAAAAAARVPGLQLSGGFGSGGGDGRSSSPGGLAR